MKRRSPRLDVLPNPDLKHQVTECPLLEGNMEQWIVCCSQRFFPLARRIAGENSLAEDALQTSWLKILQSINSAYFDGPKGLFLGGEDRSQCGPGSEPSEATETRNPSCSDPD